MTVRRWFEFGVHLIDEKRQDEDSVRTAGEGLPMYFHPAQSEGWATTEAQRTQRDRVTIRRTKSWEQPFKCIRHWGRGSWNRRIRDAFVRNCNCEAFHS